MHLDKFTFVEERKRNDGLCDYFEVKLWNIVSTCLSYLYHFNIQKGTINSILSYSVWHKQTNKQMLQVAIIQYN